MSDDLRRRVPRTDALLAAPELAERLAEWGPVLVKRSVVAAQEEARRGALTPEAIINRSLELSAAPAGRPCTLRPALNATGVVVHTNLGRAPLSQAAITALTVASGYVDVEYDASSGARAQRGRGTLAALREACPAAEAALVVNNGAAALSLVLTALAGGGRGRVAISRGELVEIGGGFRIPELIEATGVGIAEVGTTNRTHAPDYLAAGAAPSGVAALLKIHPSNFRVEGFTAQPSVAELAQVAAELGVPLIVDIGSGLLARDPTLPAEPDATSALQAGADLVTCSGDKLLGGPQAGLVLGRADLVEAARQHPLQRAFRADKLTLAALEATLRGPQPPVTTYRRRSQSDVRALADSLAAGLSAYLPVDVVPVDGRVGGGGAPGVRLPGWAVALPEDYAQELRRGDVLVVARLEGGRCLLDPRCLDEADVPRLIDAVVAAAIRLASGPGGPGCPGDPGVVDARGDD